MAIPFPFGSRRFSNLKVQVSPEIPSNRFTAYWYRDGIRILGRDEDNQPVEPVAITLQQMERIISHSTEKKLGLFAGREAAFMRYGGHELIVTAGVAFALAVFKCDERPVRERAANPFTADAAIPDEEAIIGTVETQFPD